MKTIKLVPQQKVRFRGKEATFVRHENRQRAGSKEIDIYVMVQVAQQFYVVPIGDVEIIKPKAAPQEKAAPKPAPEVKAAPKPKAKAAPKAKATPKPKAKATPKKKATKKVASKKK